MHATVQKPRNDQSKVTGRKQYKDKMRTVPGHSLWETRLSCLKRVFEIPSLNRAWRLRTMDGAMAWQLEGLLDVDTGECNTCIHPLST